MASSYPGSLDAFDSIASDKKTSDVVGGRTHRDMHNDLGDAIEAVQAELGTDPAGAYATVKARFEAIEGATLPAVDAKGDLIVGTADNTYDNLTVGANNTVLVADSVQSKGVKWASTVGVWTVAGLHVGYTAKTGAYTATTADDVINVTSGTFTLDLPAASTCTGKTLKVKNSGTGVVTLDGNSAETVEGVATFPLGPGSYVEITSTGSAWILTGGTPDTGWRDVSAALEAGWTTDTFIHLKRRGNDVILTARLKRSADGSGRNAASPIYSLLSGFRCTTYGRVFGSAYRSTTAVLGIINDFGSTNRLDSIFPTDTNTWATNDACRFHCVWSTTDAWPTSLPGTAA